MIAPFRFQKPADLLRLAGVASPSALAGSVLSLSLCAILGCSSEPEFTASVTSQSLDLSLAPKAPGTDDTEQRIEELPPQQAASAPLADEHRRDVYFPLNRHDLSDDGRQVLSRYAEWLLANPDKHVIVEGHCDGSGTNAYNLQLGEKRARAVAQHLAQLGVGLDRLSTVSHGKSRPLCTEKTEACASQNRRVHILIPE